MRNCFKLTVGKYHAARLKAWGKWKSFVAKTKAGVLLNAVKTEKLRFYLRRVPGRVLRSSFERLIGDGNRVKGALRRLEIGFSKVTLSGFRRWQDFCIARRAQDSLKKLKAAQLKNSLQRIPRRVVRDAYDRILGDGKVVAGAMRRLALQIQKRKQAAFLLWKSKAQVSKHSSLSKGNKLKNLLHKAANRTLRSAFTKILGDKRAHRALARLVRNQTMQQLSGIECLKERVYKIKLIRKISAAYILMKKLRLKADQMVKGRFNIWRNLDWLKKRRLLRKYTLNLMFFTSVCYQSGFWRWKYTIVHHWRELHPLHSIMYKRLSNIAFNYQRRLVQFALFKVVLFYRSSTRGKKTSMQLALSTLIRAHDQDMDRARSPSGDGSRASINSGEPIVASQISTNPSAKTTKEDILAINQLGGAEIIMLHLREARKRKATWALTSISTFSRHVGFFDDERSRLVEQINELRYDKHSLLEDNTALRMHNEALIENLEKTNIEFASLSLHLDQMRIARMVRAISKMIDLPILEAMIILKHHNPRVNSSLISN